MVQNYVDWISIGLAGFDFEQLHQGPHKQSGDSSHIRPYIATVPDDCSHKSAHKRLKHRTY